ncbi:MAG: A/G-specific adenine glycosylase [Alphaproteobacteria bacterium]
MLPFLTQELLVWYGQHARHLPWRARPGETPNPYHVWLSEMMLQQTQVVTVIPYFTIFVERWPTLDSLAKASLEEVMHAWQGLGYYRRARALKECAEIISRERGGELPKEETLLRHLPGLGPYTAAAVAAIAFEKQAVAIDGNIMRVFSRYYLLDAQGPTALRKEVLSLAEQALPQTQVGDYTQALMDLGATLCKPQQPFCSACPIQRGCRAFQQQVMDHFPRKQAKVTLPVRRGTVFLLENLNGQILIHPQQTEALLKGLMTFPSTSWEEGSDEQQPIPEDLRFLCAKAQRGHLEALVRHTFTHFKLELRVWHGKLDKPFQKELPRQGKWVDPSDFSHYAFSTLMKKVAHCLKIAHLV